MPGHLFTFQIGSGKKPVVFSIPTALRPSERRSRWKRKLLFLLVPLTSTIRGPSQKGDVGWQVACYH
jgi:hypothetical protein